jgi:hypothetical protein
MSGLDGVEKRVGRRHALLSPLRQPIPPGAALLIWDVNRLGWPALQASTSTVLPCIGPSSRSARTVAPSGDWSGLRWTAVSSLVLGLDSAASAGRLGKLFDPRRDGSERARAAARPALALAGSVREAVNDPHRSAAPPGGSISVAGIDDEIRCRHRARDRAHPAQRSEHRDEPLRRQPRFPATRVAPLQQTGRQAEASGARVRLEPGDQDEHTHGVDGRGRRHRGHVPAPGRQQAC